MQYPTQPKLIYSFDMYWLGVYYVQVLFGTWRNKWVNQSLYSGGGRYANKYYQAKHYKEKNEVTEW